MNGALLESPAMPSPQHEGLDAYAFPGFEPLLEACQEYAIRTGLRFSPRAFGSLDDRELTPASLPDDVPPDDASRTPAMRAAPVVHEFARRVETEEPALVADIEEAMRITVAESTRNSMICICREFDLWPPTLDAPEEEVPLEDCRYEDLDAHVLVIAQRLYNDELRRERDAMEPTSGNGDGATRRRAATASFIVDFAVAAHYEITSLAISPVLETFRQRTIEWDQLQNCAANRRPRPAELEEVSTTASSEGDHEDEEVDSNMVTKIARSVSSTPENMRRWLAASISPFTAALDVGIGLRTSPLSLNKPPSKRNKSVSSKPVPQASNRAPPPPPPPPPRIPQAVHGVIKVVMPTDVTVGTQIAFTAPNGHYMQLTCADQMLPGSVVDVLYPLVPLGHVTA
jgi:hypothetical protein